MTKFVRIQYYQKYPKYFTNRPNIWDIIEKSHYRTSTSVVRGRRLSYKMCAFAPRHTASTANRHKGGLGSPPKMLHESSSTKSWQFMAVNHSVYLVLGWAMLLHGYSAMALRTSLFKKREIPRSWTHFSPHHGADQKQL